MDSLVPNAPHRRRSSLLLVSLWCAAVAALDINLLTTVVICPDVSIYQTNGLCHDYCMPKGLAYAVTQGNSCWCSDYTPADAVQVSDSKCSQPCPAYPSEKCGGDGVFGYIALNNVLPSGTKGPIESSSTPASTSSSPSSKSSVSGTTTPPTTSSIVQTVTAGGTVRTVTISPTQTNQASNDRAGFPMQSSGLGTGAVVGIVVAIVVVILACVALGLFMYFRRQAKKQNQSDYPDDPSIRGSSSNMMGGRPEMSGISGASSSPSSAAAAAAAAAVAAASAGGRNSLLQVDPRMDPFKQGLYARAGSHESVNTLRDDHDYSRKIQQPKVLRAMNPDPVVN
ncbi:hypothetical protein RJ55_04113 [Drechmeria coniospora]|nr:hypothetical protein RJ55_04113 [Drechmeria coniospora]